MLHYACSHVRNNVGIASDSLFTWGGGGGKFLRKAHWSNALYTLTKEGFGPRFFFSAFSFSSNSRFSLSIKVIKVLHLLCNSWIIMNKTAPELHGGHHKLFHLVFISYSWFSFFPLCCASHSGNCAQTLKAKITHSYLGTVHSTSQIPSGELLQWLSFQTDPSSQLPNKQQGKWTREGVSLHSLQPAQKELKEEIGRSIDRPLLKYIRGMTFLLWVAPFICTRRWLEGIPPPPRYEG